MKKLMRILDKIKKYYPIIFILQLPLILGFVLPITFYSNFFYVEDIIENSFVELAKKNYLIIIIISNLFCVFSLSAIPIEKKVHNKYIPSFFLIITLSLISAFSTLLSRFFVFEFYYFNIIFYIGQHIILILLLLSSLFSYQKKEFVTIFTSIIFCNILALYTGDSKYFLLTGLICIIIGWFKFSLRKFIFVASFFIFSSIFILGFKKTYRDYVHFGGMNKINYVFDERYSYAPKYNYRNYEDFFFKQKLQFILFSKSYLYSNVCGEGHKYINDRYIERLIFMMIYDQAGGFKKERVPIEYLDYFPDIKKVILSKTNTACFYFFGFLSRIDFFSHFAQVIKEVNNFNYVKGETYKPIIYTFIPRFILKTKPVENSSEVYVKLLKKFEMQDHKNKTEISINIIVEAWLNYLQKGIFLISIIFGFLLTIISILYFSNNLFLTALSSSLTINLLNFNLSLRQIISGSYQLFIIFITIYYLNIILLKYYRKLQVKKNII